MTDFSWNDDDNLKYFIGVLMMFTVLQKAGYLGRFSLNSTK